MGTISTTKIYSQYGDGERELLLSLYKQYDGDTESWGQELKDFINDGVFCNGINDSKNTKKYLFNGMGDFALQLVKKFKEEAGGLYATTKDDSQEYNYHITYVYPISDDKQQVVNKLTNEDRLKAKIIIECDEEASYREEIIVNVE